MAGTCSCSLPGSIDAPVAAKALTLTLILTLALGAGPDPDPDPDPDRNAPVAAQVHPLTAVHVAAHLPVCMYACM